MRVVLDTNILISALIFPGGAPEALYRLALEGRVDLVTSRPLLAEFGRILTDKFGWEPGRAVEAVAQVTRIGAVVEPTETIRVIEEDPADDRVLEAASEGAAEVIIPGDRHRLGLRSWQGIRIVKASAFLPEFE